MFSKYLLFILIEGETSLFESRLVLFSDAFCYYSSFISISSVVLSPGMISTSSFLMTNLVLFSGKFLGYYF